MRLRFATYLLISATSLSGLAATSASAEPLLFTLSGPDPASFMMDSHPVVTPANLGANLYIARDLTVDFDGVTRKYDVLFSDDILRPASVAGIELHSHATGYADDLVGDQVFSGPYTDPTFSPQTFYLTDEYSGLPETLTISAAPEPSMWALMFAGLSGVGLTLRRSRKGMAANLVAL